MSKALIIVGSLIIIHTLIAKFTGIYSISDYLPVEWFMEKPKNGTYLKLSPSDITSHLNLYTYLVGGSFILLGFLLFYFKKRTK